MAAPQNFRPRLDLLPLSKGSAGGRYRLSFASGLLTLVAAKTATAGHLAALRNSSATKTLLLERLKIRLAVITDFTSAQRLGASAWIARSYTASHTGGTAATLTTNNAKKRTSDPTTALGDARIGTTGELTAGTHTLDAVASLIAEGGVADAGATVENKVIENEWSEKESGSPIILAQNEGIVIANNVLMGAAGTVALTVEAEWRELLNAEVDAAL